MTVKFGVHGGTIPVNTVTLHTEESTALGSLYPQIRIGIAAGIGDTSVIDSTGARQSYSLWQYNTEVATSVNSFVFAHVAARADAGEDRDTQTRWSGLGGNALVGPGYVDGGGGGYGLWTQSIGPNRVYTSGNWGAGGSANSVAYSTMLIAGSMDHRLASFTYGSQTGNVGDTLTLSTAVGTPDLVIFMKASGNAGNEFQANLLRTSFGFYDCQSQFGGRYVELDWSSDATDTGYPQFSITRSKMLSTMGEGLWDSYCTQASLTVNGPAIVVASARSGNPNNIPSTRLYYQAIKWPSGYSSRIGEVQVSTAGVVTNSIQTNSIIPEAIIGLGVIANTLDYQPSNGVNSAPSGTVGFWTKSEGVVPPATTANRVNGNTHKSIMSSGGYWLQTLVGSGSTVAWNMYSLESGENGFSFTSATSTDWPNPRVGYLAMGQTTNAPDHLMGPDGESIFLADDSDYYDNLLLLESVEELNPPKFGGSILNQTKTTSEFWQEDYSSVTTGDYTFRMVRNAGVSSLSVPTIGTYRWGISYDTGSGQVHARIASRMDTGTDRDSFVTVLSNDIVGPLYIEGGTTLDQAQFAASSGGVVELQAATGIAYSNSVWYNAVVFAGSADAKAVAWDSFTTNSLDLIAVASFGFDPQLIWIYRGFNNGGDGVFGNVNVTNGFVDVRSDPTGFFSAAAFSTTGPQAGFLFSNTLFYDNGISDVALRRPMKIVQSYNNNIGLQVVSLTGGDHTVRPVAFGVRFLDDTHFHVGITDVGTSTVEETRSVQTNSLLPDFIEGWLSTVATLDFDPAATTSAPSWSMGMWVRSAGYGGMNTHLSVAGGESRANMVTQDFARPMDTNTNSAGAYAVYSVDAGSGGFSYTVRSPAAGGPDGLFGYVAIGRAVSAPAHLMGSGGESIFLADDSDYKDNLVLTGETGGEPVTPINVGSCYTAVLSNGGYEEGNLNGWDVWYGTTTDVVTVNAGTGLVNAVEGSYFARGASNTERGVWKQDFTVPSSFNVNTGNVYASYSFYTTDYATDTDRGFAYIHMINSDGEVAAGWCSSATSNFNETWNVVSAINMVPIPPGTAKVRVGYSAWRQSGTELSWYVDAGTLEFCTSSLFMVDASPVNKDWGTVSTQSWTVTSNAITINSGQAYNNWRVTPGIPAHTYGSAVSYFSAEQKVTIPNTLNVISTWIGAGSAFFTYRYLLGSFGGLDEGLVQVDFLNAGDTVVGTLTHVNSPFAGMTQGYVYTGSVIMPIGTRKINYRLIGVRQDGTNLDAYITGINGQVVVGSPLGEFVAGSAGPADAAGPLFRASPVTENRQFPTPRYEIREFPNE